MRHIPGLFSKQIVNKLLPVIEVHMNRIKRVALVDTGCSQSLVSKVVCQSWWEKEGDVLNGNTFRCCGLGNTKLGVDDVVPLTSVLVVGEQLLGFDL